MPEKLASDALHRRWKRAKPYERERFLADVTSEHRSRVERAKTQIDAMTSEEQRDLRYFDEFDRAQPDVSSTISHPQPNPQRLPNITSCDLWLDGCGSPSWPSTSWGRRDRPPSEWCPRVIKTNLLLIRWVERPQETLYACVACLPAF